MSFKCLRWETASKSNQSSTAWILGGPTAVARRKAGAKVAAFGFHATALSSFSWPRMTIF
jgi:hypothetical protein